MWKMKCFANKFVVIIPLGYKNVNKWQIILYLGCNASQTFWPVFFDSFINHFLSICPKLLSTMSPSSFEIRLFLSSAAHKAIDGFLLSQYLSTELFTPVVVIFPFLCGGRSICIVRFNNFTGRNRDVVVSFGEK